MLTTVQNGRKWVWTIMGQYQCGANINRLSGAYKLLRISQNKYPSTVVIPVRHDGKVHWECHKQYLDATIQGFSHG